MLTALQRQISTGKQHILTDDQKREWFAAGTSIQPTTQPKATVHQPVKTTQGIQQALLETKEDCLYILPGNPPATVKFQLVRPVPKTLEVLIKFAEQLILDDGKWNGDKIEPVVPANTSMLDRRYIASEVARDIFKKAVKPNDPQDSKLAYYWFAQHRMDLIDKIDALKLKSLLEEYQVLAQSYPPQSLRPFNLDLCKALLTALEEGNLKNFSQGFHDFCQLLTKNLEIGKKQIEDEAYLIELHRNGAGKGEQFAKEHREELKPFEKIHKEIIEAGKQITEILSLMNKCIPMMGNTSDSKQHNLVVQGPKVQSGIPVKADKMQVKAADSGKFEAKTGSVVKPQEPAAKPGQGHPNNTKLVVTESGQYRISRKSSSPTEGLDKTPSPVEGDNVNLARVQYGAS